MNTFMNELTKATNLTYTENGAVARKSTLSALYDMFAFGGAYRSRSAEDCILLFKNAYEEDAIYALKCLFYLGDIRGGQGERRFFRVCFNWLAKNYPTAAAKYLDKIPEYRRWDDILYTCVGTPVEDLALSYFGNQLTLDNGSKTPSLCGKWAPSENASSTETKRMAGILRQHMGLTHKEYRKMLSAIRNKINIVERLMSENRWDEIEFDKIPSKAGLKYSNTFAVNEVTAARYKAFIENKETKVHADTLYPYDIVSKAKRFNLANREAINKYWENQKDYLNGQPCKMLCVCDTSESMTWGNGQVMPIDVAIGLSLYCAERVGEPFRNHYISFASRPQLIKTEGIDFVDKVNRIYRTNLCDNTDLVKTFALLKEISLKANPEDRLDTVVVISDMEIDEATSDWSWEDSKWTSTTAETEMEKIRKEWEAVGLKMPKLVYWNVDARNNTILDAGPNVSFVSGCSPVIFEQILAGKSGFDLMMDKLNSKRYEAIC